MTKPVPLKATSISEMVASAKAKADAFEKLSPEERAAKIKETRELLAKLGPDGPTAIVIGKR